jgi:hypothetical protein
LDYADQWLEAKRINRDGPSNEESDWTGPPPNFNLTISRNKPGLDHRSTRLDLVPWHRHDNVDNEECAGNPGHIPDPQKSLYGNVALERVAEVQLLGYERITELSFQGSYEHSYENNFDRTYVYKGPPRLLDLFHVVCTGIVGMG